MRKPIMLLVAVFLAAATQATISADENSRLTNAAQVLREIRNVPDKGIPEELWEHAECVTVIPDVKKAAFIVGGEYGKGVMSCRNGSAWSAPLFVKLAKGSWGAQIGAQSIDLVLLFMNRKGVDKLIDNQVTFGADASIAAGPVGRTAQAGTDVQLHSEILSYSRSKGVFVGIDLSGGTLGPDKEDNQQVYGPSVIAQQIIRGSLKPPAAASGFMAALRTQPGQVRTSGQVQKKKQ